MLSTLVSTASFAPLQSSVNWEVIVLLLVGTIAVVGIGWLLTKGSGGGGAD